MVIFADNATSSYGHKDPAVVTQVIKKNFTAIETYMNANKLMVNSDKTHLLVMANSSGGAVRGQEAAVRRAAVTFTAGNENIKQSNNEVLLGATIHHTGGWAAMVRGAAPDYLMQTLQVQQMAAARAVLGHFS